MDSIPISCLLVFSVCFSASLQVVATEKIRNEHFLFAGNNGPNGSASITVKTHLGDEQTFNFVGHVISPACSSHPLRCRQLTIATYSPSQYIVLVPLDTFIGIMEFEYEQDEFLHRNTHVNNLIEGGLTHCTPLSIFQHHNSIYSVCSSGHTFYFCEIIVDPVNIAQSRTRCTSSLRSDTSSPITTSLVSNFVFVPLGSNNHFAFAYGTKLYKVFPERHTFGQYNHGFDVVTGPCEHLEIGGTHQLIAYCYHEDVNTTIAVYYNVYDESFDSDPNIPYICPNPTSNVTTFPGESYIHYNDENSVMVLVNITGTDLYSGVCFDSEGSPTFIFLDKVRGLFVVNIITSEEQHFQLPYQICTNSSLCDRPLVYDEQYIIIQKINSANSQSIVTILEARTEYSSIITITEMNALIVALIPFEQEIAVSTNAPSVTTIPDKHLRTTERSNIQNPEDKSSDDGEKTLNVVPIAIVISIAAVVLVLVCVIASIPVVRRCVKKRRKLNRRKTDDQRVVQLMEVHTTGQDNDRDSDHISEPGSTDNLVDDEASVDLPHTPVDFITRYESNPTLVPDGSTVLTRKQLNNTSLNQEPHLEEVLVTPHEEVSTSDTNPDPRSAGLGGQTGPTPDNDQALLNHSTNSTPSSMARTPPTLHGVPDSAHNLSTAQLVM